MRIHLCLESHPQSSEPDRKHKWLKRARWKKKIRKFESCLKLKITCIDEGWVVVTVKLPIDQLPCRKGQFLKTRQKS